MKITFLTGYFHPELSADTRLNLDLAHSLAESGFEVTVIVPFPTRGVPDIIQQEYIEKKEEQLSNNLRIIRIGNPSTYQQSIVSRGFSLLKKSWQMFTTAKSIDTDLYLIISTPPFLGYAAALLSKNKPVIYKLEDIFPDSLKYTMNLKESHPAVLLLRKLEKWVYKKVSSIVVVSHDMKRTIIEHGAPAAKISTIYDWIDENACCPVSKDDNYLFDKFNLPRDKFYVCYAGNIGHLQNIHTLVKASELLEEQCPEIKFVVIGDGAWKKEMLSILEASPHNNFFHFPMQPTDQIAYVYSLGDIGIVSLKPDITKYALPSKTWDILSAGRPAICEIDLYSSLCSIIENNQCGYSVAPNDAQALADKIIYLYKHQDECQQAGSNGRNYILDNITRKAAAERYCKLITVMINKFRSSEHVHI